MKKILLTIAFMLTMLATAHADTRTIAGAVYTSSSLNDVLTNQLFGSTSGWQADNANNDMILYSGNKYYLVKEITLDDSSDAMIEFKVCKNHSWDESHPYGNLNGVDNSNGNAWVYLKKPSSGTKTYELLFTFDSSDTGSLDVVQMAKVVDNDYATSTDDETWATYLESNAMTLDNLTYTFSKEFTNVTAGTAKTFNALTIHRSPTYADKGKTNNNVQKSVDKVNGTSSQTVTFPYAGDYQVDFEYNLLSGEFNVTSRRYHDVFITAAGNNLGQSVTYGYATFSCDYATVVPDGVNAYYITGTDKGEFTTESTDFVPATVFPSSGNNYPRTGVVLQAEVNSTTPYRFFEYTGTETITLTDNKLCATGAQTIEAPSITISYYYVLGKVGDVVAFYKAKNGNSSQNTYPAYKAFYYTGTIHSREYYTLDFINEESSIESFQTELSHKEVLDGVCYNLQGQAVSHPTKGLYIQKGRKVFMK